MATTSSPIHWSPCKSPKQCNRRSQWKGCPFLVYHHSCIATFSFSLHKQAFGQQKVLLLHCPCGYPFSVSHAFSCPKGDIPTIWHTYAYKGYLRLLRPNVGVEPTPHFLCMQYQHWERSKTRHQSPKHLEQQQVKYLYFDVRVLNSHAPSNCTFSTGIYYQMHDRIKGEHTSNLTWSRTGNILETMAHFPWLPSTGLQACVISKKHGLT